MMRRRRRAAAVVMVQAFVRGMIVRRSIPRRIASRREEVIELARRAVEQVATFKTRPCPYGRHESREKAMSCPYHHGRTDRRAVEDIFTAPSSCAKYQTFQQMSSASLFRTRRCYGGCEERVRNGGLCPFAHSPIERLEALPEGECFGTRAVYENFVIQQMLLSANLPLWYDEPVPSSPKKVITTAPPLPPEEAAAPRRAPANLPRTTAFGECIVCLDASCDTALGCGHLQVCQSCAATLQSCPTCRTAITLKLRVFA